jgi:hypothetical protein
MRMNRRNVLVGIGGTVIAGGAALGTGAFSQVEASRTVSVSTEGDADALLAFDVDTDYNGLEDGDDDIVEFHFEDINQEAVTRFDDALTVTNNGSEDVDLEVTDVPDAITFDGVSETVTADEGSIDVTITIDLYEEDEPEDGDITFTAESTE